MTHPDYDVLVVGAGPAGLATAVAAHRHGARVLLVERRPALSPYPRATGVSTRTMEILRTWGARGGGARRGDGRRAGHGDPPLARRTPDADGAAGLPDGGAGPGGEPGDGTVLPAGPRRAGAARAPA